MFFQVADISLGYHFGHSHGQCCYRFYRGGSPVNLFLPRPESLEQLRPISMSNRFPSRAVLDHSLADGMYRVSADKATVILLHGIRGSRLQMVDRARLLTRNGYSVLLIDLQAHGESSGEYITAGHLERFDVQAAVRFARKRNPRLPLAVIGVSLGGAATLLASPLEIDAAILESVYPTIGKAVDNRIRLRLGPLSPFATQALLLQLRPRLGISPTQLRPLDNISRIGCPVLLMAGTDDRHTSPAETRRLFDAASEPKQLQLIDGAAHVDLCRFDSTLYAQVVLAFLGRHLGSG